MGCSPSKGHSLNGVQNTLKKESTLLPASQEKNGASHMDDGKSSLNPGEAVDKVWVRGAGKGGLTEEEGQVTPAAQLPQKPTPLSPRRPSLCTATPAGPVSHRLCTQEIDMRSGVKETYGDAVEEKMEKKARHKARKSKQVSRKAKEKKAPVVKEKFDFPEPLVKAHHAAYGYLNPSIAKYEVLLGLLDQALQTQLSLQPMVSFMTLRYEEINCMLAQIANEGESVLTENEEHLPWHCTVKNTAGKTKDPVTVAEQPPDLLQQLLQYTTQRMRSVSHSLGSVADSALEDAVEYFASVSELLDEKLKVRRAVEARLAQVLTRIELAAVRKPGPDDSTLYSEDSGIGPESWSLVGSERRRESWESAGVVGATSDTPLKCRGSSSRRMRRMSTSMSLNSTDSSCTIAAKEQGGSKSLLGLASMDDGDEEEDDSEEEIEGDANCPPPDRRHLPRRLPTQRIENPQNVEMTLRMKDAITGRIAFVPSQSPTSKVKQANSSGKERPQWMEEKQKLKRSQSAAQAATSVEAKKKVSVPTQRRSRSSESQRSKAEELERTQQSLNQRFGRMIMIGSEEDNRGRSPKRRGAGKLPGTQSTASSRQCSSLPRNFSACTSQEKLKPRRNSLGEKGGDTREDDKRKEIKSGKGPLVASPPPSTPPSMVEQSPPWNTGTSSVKRLIDTFSQGLEEKHLKGSALLGPLRGVRKCGIPIIPGLGIKEVILTNGTNSHQVDSNDSNRAEDLDIDNLPPPPPEVLMDKSFESNDGRNGTGSTGFSPALQRTTVSQRLRAFTQSVTVLPSRSSLRRVIPKVSPVQPTCRDATSDPQTCQSGTSSQDLKSEEVAPVFKRVQTILHIRHSSGSSTENSQVDTGPKNSLLTRADSGGRQGGDNPIEPVPSTSAANSQLPATAPVSRARVLPSPPPKPVSQHRRLPSPPVLKQQTAPPTSCSPPSNRKLPTPPLKPRSLPSPPQVNKAIHFQRMSSPLVSRREVTQNATYTSYAFKTPSPPASPKVQRFSRDNSSEDTAPWPASKPRASGNARSVFCPVSPSLFEARPWPTSCTPQAWTPARGSLMNQSLGEPSRAMLPICVRGSRPFVRRSQSDRRPSLTLPTWTPTFSITRSSGSEPAISIQGLGDGPNREEEVWGSQSDLWAVSRSASQPDLCIVGHALHRE